jgi:hypothetical protein
MSSRAALMLPTTIDILPVRTIMRVSGTFDDMVDPPDADGADVTVIDGAGMEPLPKLADVVIGGEAT